MNTPSARGGGIRGKVTDVALDGRFDWHSCRTHHDSALDRFRIRPRYTRGFSAMRPELFVRDRRANRAVFWQSSFAQMTRSIGGGTFPLSRTKPWSSQTTVLLFHEPPATHQVVAWRSSGTLALRTAQCRRSLLGLSSKRKPQLILLRPSHGYPLLHRLRARQTSAA
jgi:hypothetical protein